MYPRQLSLDAGTKERLISYLNTEIINHNAERSPYLSEIEVYQDLYWAKPILGMDGAGPIQGGSNLIIPLIAISVEATHARNMTTLFALDDFCQLALPDRYSDIDKGLEKLLDHEMLVTAELYKFADSCLLEGTKFGTGIGKTGYERVVRTAVSEVNGDRRYTDVVVKQGLVIDPVATANFCMPYAYQDEQTAPWVGEEHESSLFLIKDYENSGFFLPGTYEALLSYYTPQSPQTLGQEVKQNQEILENKQSYLPKTIRWYEIWLTFDVDGSSKQRELVVHYHWYAQRLMAIRDNWHTDLHRPYRHYAHFKLEHRWTGMGQCKMLDQFQMEVTTQHRQRIDNATLANLRMFKIRKLSGFGPNEPLFPGKIWYVDEMDDVDSIQLGEIYPSSYNNEQQAVLYSQQRSGVNELTLGMPQAGTPGTASSDLTRVQESNRRFDYTYKNIKNFMKEITSDSLCVIKQFGVRSASIYENIPNGLGVKAFIDETSISDLREQITIGIGVAGQNQNKLLDRSSWTQLSGMLTQYYTNMLTLAQQSGNAGLVQLLTQKAFSAGSESMKQILESFDVRNINKIIITPEDLMKVGLIAPPAQDGSNGLPQGNGISPTGNQTPSGLSLPPGLGIVNPITIQGGGTGV